MRVHFGKAAEQQALLPIDCWQKYFTASLLDYSDPDFSQSAQQVEQDQRNVFGCMCLASLAGSQVRAGV